MLLTNVSSPISYLCSTVDNLIITNDTCDHKWYYYGSGIFSKTNDNSS